MKKQYSLLIALAVLLLVGCQDIPTSPLEVGDDEGLLAAANPGGGDREGDKNGAVKLDVVVSFSHSVGLPGEIVYDDGPVTNGSEMVIGHCVDGHFVNRAGNTTEDLNEGHCPGTQSEGETYGMPPVDALLQKNNNLLFIEFESGKVKYQEQADRTTVDAEGHLLSSDAESPIQWRLDLDQFASEDNRFNASDETATALTARDGTEECPTTAEYSQDGGKTWSEPVCGTVTWAEVAGE